MPALFTRMSSCAERLDRGVHHALAALPARDVVGVGDRLAAHLLDLVHDLLGRGAVVARAVGVATEVVHDDLRALSREEQRVLAADAATRARDDGDASIESAHG